MLKRLFFTRHRACPYLTGSEVKQSIKSIALPPRHCELAKQSLKGFPLPKEITSSCLLPDARDRRNDGRFRHCEPAKQSFSFVIAACPDLSGNGTQWSEAISKLQE